MLVKRSCWLVAVLVWSGCLFGCAKPPAAQPVVEQPPAATAPTTETASQSPQPIPASELPSAKPEEVQEVIKRVFKGAVAIDQTRNPSVFVADFNGDLSQDLAVILTPAAGKLSELNQEFPSWIAREPVNDLLLPKSKALTQTVAARPSSNAAAGQTIRFKESDVLLAIIHGYGPKGWHDPEATQTHLLRDVVGSNMRTLPLKGAVKAYGGVRPFPTIYGDLLQQSLIGQSGFLYFAGGVYGWYDPKNYKPAAAPVHSAMSGMK